MKMMENDLSSQDVTRGSSPVPASPDQPDFTGDPRWQLVERILASPLFHSAPRLRQFLLHVSERAIRGETEGLNEQEIGTALFGRGGAYDCNVDNIVRVHARHLRVKLKEYFNAADREEALILEIPRGSYVPLFRSRSAAEADVTAEPQSGNSSREEQNAPWPLSRVVNETMRTNVVVADGSFRLLQALAGTSATLEQYLAPDYPANLAALSRGQPDRSMWSILTSHDYATFGDVVAVKRITDLAGRQRDRISIRFARDLSLRELQEGNYILLGSSLSNPWASMFEKGLNFKLDYEPGTGIPCYLNSAPRSGERDRYVASQRVNSSSGFGIVAMAPNQSQIGNVLLLQGCSAEGTEAAAMFALDPATRGQLSQAIVRAGGDPVRGYFEALLYTKTIARCAIETDLVAVRVELASNLSQS